MRFLGGGAAAAVSELDAEPPCGALPAPPACCLAAAAGGAAPWSAALLTSSCLARAASSASCWRMRAILPPRPPQRPQGSLASSAAMVSSARVALCAAVPSRCASARAAACFLPSASSASLSSLLLLLLLESLLLAPLLRRLRCCWSCCCLGDAACLRAGTRRCPGLSAAPLSLSLSLSSEEDEEEELEACMQKAREHRSQVTWSWRKRGGAPPAHELVAHRLPPASSCRQCPAPPSCTPPPRSGGSSPSLRWRPPAGERVRRRGPREDPAAPFAAATPRPRATVQRSHPQRVLLLLDLERRRNAAPLLAQPLALLPALLLQHALAKAAVGGGLVHARARHVALRELHPGHRRRVGVTSGANWGGPGDGSRWRR